ncbi:MAG: hypothetical protein PUD26_04140 [bacterium]|nr:hypothetical protein [bacterium]
MRKCKLMVSAIVAWAAASNSASAQTKPHILLIMTDQQRADAAHCRCRVAPCS